MEHTLLDSTAQRVIINSMSACLARLLHVRIGFVLCSVSGRVARAELDPGPAPELAENATQRHSCSAWNGARAREACERPSLATIWGGVSDHDKGMHRRRLQMGQGIGRRREIVERLVTVSA